MFITHKNAEVTTPFVMKEDGEHWWHYAMVTIHKPWLYVEYEPIVENPLRSMYLLERIDQLLSLQKRTDIRITEVHVVTPKYLNNTDSWRMSRVKQVLRGIQKRHGDEFPVEIYVFNDGTEEYYSPYGLIKKKPRNCEVIFSI